jgi:hypothetical protein
MAISETPVTFPLGRDRLLTKPVATGSPPDSVATIGMVVVAILGGDGRRTAKSQDHVYVARHEIFGKLWELFPMVPASTEFEHHVAIRHVAVIR